MNIFIMSAMFFLCVFLCFKLHDIETGKSYIAVMLFALQLFFLMSASFCFMYLAYVVFN